MIAFPIRALPTAGDAPGQFCQLGVDAAIGSRSWDVQARIILHIGPLDLDGFEAMLPDRGLLQRIAALVRAYLGFETDFANVDITSTPVPNDRPGVLPYWTDLSFQVAGGGADHRSPPARAL